MPELEIKDVVESVNTVNTAFAAFKTANDERIAQLEAKGSVDPLLSDKLVKIEADMDKHQSRLDEHELSQKRSNRIATDKDGNEIDLDKKAFNWAKPIGRERGSEVTSFNNEDMEAYKSAYASLLHGGQSMLSADEVKALSVGSDPSGGYRVHPDMSGRISRRIFESSPMRAYASIQSISTDSLEGTYDNDEAGYGWVGENGARSETDTPEAGTWRIPVREIFAYPFATQRILDDSEINEEMWLSEKVSSRFARAEATGFVTGNTPNMPRGFLTYADYATAGTFQLGAIEQFDTGANGGFVAAPSSGDVLYDAIYGLKAPYRQNANWFMNRLTAKAVRKMKDSDGAYLWTPGIVAGQSSTLAGYAVASFEDMPDPATGSLSMAFGDMREAYQIVDRVGIRVLRDPYDVKGKIGFYTTKRVGGDVVNFEALKLIKFAA